MSQVISVLVLVTLFGTFVFYLLAFPIWMIVHCTNSGRLSKGAKGFWIALTAISGTIGAGLYAVFVSGRRALRWTGGFGLAIGLLAVVGFLMLGSYLKDAFPQEIGETVAILNQAELVELTEQEREGIRVALATLEEEVRRAFILSDRGMVCIRLNDLIELMLQDGTFTHAEHDEWLRYFELRHLISGDELEEHVRLLRGGR